MSRIPDSEIIGIKYNFLTPLYEIEKKGDKRVFHCLCECGNECDVMLGHIRNSKTKSCGCQKNKKIYSESELPLALIFRGIKKRCYNENSKSYHRYGGRGIKICYEWLSDTKAFISWAKENGWKSGLEIDRKDNDGNYSPKNCRFITSKKNCQNQRRSKYWFIDGIKYNSISDAAGSLKVSGSTIRAMCDGRILESGNFSPPRKNCWSELKYKETIKMSNEIKEIQGDFFTNDAQMIVHGTNIRGVFGAGIAVPIKKKYPLNFKAYEFACIEGVDLGEVIFNDEDDGTIIANALTQDLGKLTEDGLPISYKAIRDCMRNVLSHAIDNNITTIAMPRIGAGLGGGDWDKIKTIIDEVFDEVDGGIELIIYYL